MTTTKSAPMPRSGFIKMLTDPNDVSKVMGVRAYQEAPDFINRLGAAIHVLNKKWWIDLETGEPIKRNKGEMIALMHSELSEMLEGVRKDLMDDHIPGRMAEEVEAADLLIRLLDYCNGHGLDIGHAFIEKCVYNSFRDDHKLENRRKPGGKKI